MAPRRTSAATRIQPAVRCAVYARVSTDAQVDKEFNSLDAQAQACETYVGLHREEGWTVAGDCYQDAGLSGSNTNRPALQRLIADIEAGTVDVVVVYKYDRLSRSMLDFLQILDLFKRHGVSFVSVSQRFDTSTPVGEMTVNILLSFAQFERQIIAERTRDKIHAARSRGRWTGGHPPLGYNVTPEGGRIIVNKPEAEQVRAIFELYAENPSLVVVSQELNRRGWRRKSWTTKTGNFRQGKVWDRVTLSRLLQDPLYIGKQKLGDEVFPGEHERIITNKLFDEVQTRLDQNRRDGGARARNRYGALLRGLLRCAACDRAMTHAPTKRNGRVHRYYRCQGAQKNGHRACPTRSVSAHKIETFVVDQIRRIGTDRKLQDETFRQALAQVKAQQRGLRLEAKTIKKDLARAKENVERLAQTLSRLDGSASEAIADELGKAQELSSTLRSRQAEITVELHAIKTQDVNRDDLAKALEDFDPIWDALMTPEKERVLRLLIERVDYHGGTGEMAISWRLSGFGELAAEVAP